MNPNPLTDFMVQALLSGLVRSYLNRRGETASPATKSGR